MIKKNHPNYKLILLIILVGMIAAASTILISIYTNSTNKDQIVNRTPRTTQLGQNDQGKDQVNVQFGTLTLDYEANEPDDQLNEYIVSEIENSGAVFTSKKVGYQTEYLFDSDKGEVKLTYFYAHGIPCPETGACGKPSFTITYPKGLYLIINPNFNNFKIETITPAF